MLNTPTLKFSLIINSCSDTKDIILTAVILSVVAEVVVAHSNSDSGSKRSSRSSSCSSDNVDNDGE